MNNRNRFFSLIVLALCCTFHLSSFEFNKVVIWGQISSTYEDLNITNAFYNAFKYLGYDTFLFNKDSDLRNFDFSNTLLITEGQVDQNIPLREDCFYILITSLPRKYVHLFSLNKCMIVQVYTDVALSTPTANRVAPFVYQDLTNRTLYMPPASDLLPTEIDTKKIKTIIENNSPRHHNRVKYVAWVDSIISGLFGNQSELSAFAIAAQQAGIRFVHKARLFPRQEDLFLERAYMAPTILGTWEREIGYIPYSIFKKITSGQMGITNSNRLHQLFNETLIYDPDPAVLFNKAQEALSSFDNTKRTALMDFVKENHTYVNRIQSILNFMNEIN